MGNAKRLAWLAAAVAVVLVALAFGKDWERADAWSQPPSVFTVRPVACGRRYSGARRYGSPSLSTRPWRRRPQCWSSMGQSMRALRSRAARSAACAAGICSATSAVAFTCNAGVTGAGSIPPLVVSTVVATGLRMARQSRKPRGRSLAEDGAVLAGGPRSDRSGVTARHSDRDQRDDVCRNVGIRSVCLRRRKPDLHGRGLKHDASRGDRPLFARPWRSRTGQ